MPTEQELSPPLPAIRRFPETENEQKTFPDIGEKPMIGNAAFYPGSAVVNARLTGGILYALERDQLLPDGIRAAIRPTRFDSGML